MKALSLCEIINLLQVHFYYHHFKICILILTYKFYLKNHCELVKILVKAISKNRMEFLIMALIDTFATGLQHIGIPTSNMAATSDFWAKLGFSLKGEFNNDGSLVRFFEFHGLVIETWESAEVNPHAGTINHISLNATDIENAFKTLKAHGFEIIEDQIQELPFWDNGIRYFNVLGPNGEIVEFCKIN